MLDIQPAAAEIREEKKKGEDRRKKPQGKLLPARLIFSLTTSYQYDNEMD